MWIWLLIVGWMIWFWWWWFCMIRCISGREFFMNGVVLNKVVLIVWVLFGVCWRIVLICWWSGLLFVSCCIWVCGLISGIYVLVIWCFFVFGLGCMLVFMILIIIFFMFWVVRVWCVFCWIIFIGNWCFIRCVVCWRSIMCRLLWIVIFCIWWRIVVKKKL